MASSSLAVDREDSFDVFLSFRGQDTRYSFTSHLHDALCRKKIKAFIDYDIDRGEEITPFLEGVIDEAKISIIVFSENYAESTYCLEELARIMKCQKAKKQIVLPIFYKVEPSEEIYQEAFARHETNANWKKRRRGETAEQDRKKVERWRSAFLEAIELAGYPVVENTSEAEIIGKIIQEVSEKLNNNLPKGKERMCTSMVGQTAKDTFEEIWICLMNDKVSRVGVYGMGGVGKTTIATYINNKLLASANSFSLVCWVTVSKDLSICSTQNKIAEMVKLDFSNEDDEHERAAKLRKKLNNEKFVLFLDDVWEAFEIEEVGIPPMVGGQKLILTSRNRGVCEGMKCHPIEVKPLSKQEALDLFIKESEHKINGSLTWDIACSIVEECGGLPLAIVVIARRMRRVVEIWKWRNTLRELQKPSEGGNLEMEKKVFKVLKYSYDCLPNDEYRQCFLYCSLFPEDHEFKREDLIKYWIGEGLMDELESTQEELDKGNCIIDELIHASLLQQINDESGSRKKEISNESEFGEVKMHDVIRDMAHMNIKVGLQFENPFESVQVLKMLKRFPNSAPHCAKLEIVLKMLKSFPNSAPHCSKLKTLLLQGNDIQELSDCFFTNMQSLNVLHMTRMHYVKSIPNSITNLRNLRVLIIDHCYNHNLKCIPSFALLENLRYLKVSNNESLKEIPNGIERLVNLRMLDLSGNESLYGSFPNGVLEKLSQLHTLNLLDTKVEVESKALISLEKLEMLYVHFYNVENLDCYVKSRHWQRLLNYQIYYGSPQDVLKGHVLSNGIW